MILSIKYTIIQLIRNRANLFWILIFPIALGTLFKVAFSNISETEKFKPIPVAIVCSEGTAKETFCAIADELSKDGDDQMLISTYCTEKEAMTLLENKEIDGILYVDDDVRLTISANMSNTQINQSILSTFVDQYNINAAIFTDTAANHPDHLPALTAQMSQNINCREEISYAYHDSDTYDQYFYNLIAMACLFTACGGIYIALNNQGNLSALAARKNISATPKGVTILTELFSYTLVEFILNLLGFVFLIAVLRVELTTRLGLAILAILISTLTGISLGFFIGAIGKQSENTKTGFAFLLVMPCCFFSGLMMGDMRMIVEKYAPWFNHINPAALISDSFYSLTAYESLTRYRTNILTLLGISAFLIIGGILLTRRKQYASL